MRAAILVCAVLVPVACSPDPADDAAPPPPAATSPAPSPTSEQADTPAPVAPEHGGTYWAVYLAVGQGPDLEDAIAFLTEERGIEFPGPMDINCDEGARQALGRDAGPLSVAVYFENEENARAWAENLPGPPVGIVEVRTFCLD